MTKQEKERARRITRRALKRGELVKPAKCSRCGREDSPLQAHHHDYAKPLDVEFLCSTKPTPCHPIADGMAALERMRNEDSEK